MNSNDLLPPPKAFLLGAGLGTRLRPLTSHLPKPLVPVWNKPLLTFAIDHLSHDLHVCDLLINTHHCPERYTEVFPEKEYGSCKLQFRHEETLLDTAGGIDNIRDWLPDSGSFVVYNGDILTDLPLRQAWQQHLARGSLATLLLRSDGDELRVGFNPDTGQVVDLRGQLDPEWPHRYQFTGIYFLSCKFLRYIREGKIESIVLAFLRAIQDGQSIHGIVVDDGHWSDLGNRESYLEANRVLAQSTFPRYPTFLPPQQIHPSAVVAADSNVDRSSAIGSDCRIGPGCHLRNSVLWDHTSLAKNVALEKCIVTGDAKIHHSARDQDFESEK